MARIISTQLSLYCERVAPGLLGEPLNAISNLAFFAAAFLLIDDMCRHHVRHWQLYVLTALVALIGIGSSLFHTFATAFTGVLDVAFIGIFILTYIGIFLTRFYRFSRKRAVLGVTAFVTFAVFLGLLLSFVDAQVVAIYLASMCLLWGFAIDLERRGNLAAKPMFYAALCFSVSLTLRSFDPLICPVLPIGTHFCWHILNGGTLYLLVRLLALHGGYITARTGHEKIIS